MNWKKGFFRLWLVLSGLWVMVMLGIRFLFFGIMVEDTPPDFNLMLLIIIVPPLALLFFGLVAQYIYKGFKQT